MIRYLIRRLIYMIILLWVISLVGFWLINLAPGTALDVKNQAIQAQGAEVDARQAQAVERALGFTAPVLQRYVEWLGGILHGDFGQSFVFGQPVSQLLLSRLPVTAMIVVLGLFLSWVVAVPIGVYSATHRYTLPDYLVTFLQFVGVAVPEFLTALILLVITNALGENEFGGLLSPEFETAPLSLAKVGDFLGHLWIPVVVIGLASTAWQSRVMRANLLDVLEYQYVQTARAKGLREWIVIWKHAVRNALAPLVMSLGTQLPALFSGELVVSIVLNLPTDGPIYFAALQDKDTNLAIALLMATASLLVVGNLLADLLLAWLDPRISLE